MELQAQEIYKSTNINVHGSGNNDIKYIFLNKKIAHEQIFFKHEKQSISCTYTETGE